MSPLGELSSRHDERPAGRRAFGTKWLPQKVTGPLDTHPGTLVATPQRY